jgi:exopolyphosphatase/guanosine-5'-triphosphate,3'-diphosphate pyrophosphatase
MSEPSPSQVVAVIDIGSSAVRMTVAEIDAGGTVRELERLEQPLELGRDVFRRGSVRRKTLARLLAVISDFQRVLGVYGVSRVRAIATSALREAENSEVVLDQLYLRHGLDVELIGPAFEKRLLFLGVRAELGDGYDLDRGSCLIVEVGGGSTELTLLQQGEISATHTLPLGSVRLQEMVPATAATPKDVQRLRRRHVRQAVARVADSMPLDEVDLFVAVGGEVRFVAHHEQPDRPDRLGEIPSAAFTAFVRGVRGRSPDRIASELGMTWPKAEAFVPALLVYDYLLRQTRAEHVVVPVASLRTGILRELAAEVSGQGAGEMPALVRTSAIHLGRRFHFDEQHAMQVARLSLSLFDQLDGLHGLGARDRMLLECAAILHDIGTFVHHKDHDRHGEYLLQASEVFGLGRREHAVVAAVVRHHRVGVPGPDDPTFATLSREERLLVLRLLGLLRLGDVLDRRAQAAVASVEVERRGKRLVLRVTPAVDLYYERAAFPGKAAMFEDIFGIPVELA